MRRRVGFFERVNRALWNEDDPVLEFRFKAAIAALLLFLVGWVLWEAFR